MERQKDQGSAQPSLNGVPRLVIGGATSGVGKTTVATGIMAALTRRGLRVQPFKAGPDYIDPSYHTRATGLPSRNLDTWMLSEAAVRELFARASRGADVALVEGVMGLFDGYSGLDEGGSTAQLAKLLRAPVLLVLDAGKMARSAAAMALGYARFDPGLTLAGVLLNFLGGETHYRWAREAVEDLGGIPVVGYLPRDPELHMGERHLGLIPMAERKTLGALLDRLVETIERHVDLDRVLALARAAGPLPEPPAQIFPPVPSPAVATIAVARDEAFSFYYPENLELLEAHGARIAFFSPMRDHALPTGAQGLYMGGGFPEVYAKDLTANASLLREVRAAAAAGMPIYAECGGLMYLCEGIEDFDGARHPMAGLVPGWARMRVDRLHLGYLEAEAQAPSVVAEPGARVRGHEYHWAEWAAPPGRECPPAYRIVNQGGRPEGFAHRNLLASFLHVHFGAAPHMAARLVAACAGWRA